MTALRGPVLSGTAAPASVSIPSRPLPDAVAGRAWRRRFALRSLVGDVLVILIAIALTAAFGVTTGDRTVGGSVAVGGAIATLWIAAVVLAHSRLPRHIGTGADEYRRTITATVIAFGAVGVLSVLVSQPVPRSYVVIALPLGLGGLLLAHAANRASLRRDRRRGLSLSRVVVLGTRPDVSFVVGQIDRRRGDVEYDVVGVAVSGLETSASITVRGRVIPVVSTLDRVAQSVADLRVDAVLVAGPVDGGDAFLRRLCWALEPFATELVLAPGLSNVAGPRIHWRPVDGLPLMSVEPPRYTGTRHVLKRCVDVVLASAALLALSPLLVALAVLVQRDSPGPALFRQERIGRAGRPFTMLKFRSMGVDAEARLAGLTHLNEGSGPLFKLREDPRVTPLGRVLRRYSLDELPQFWNVLRGDMSLVGPRPPLLREVERYDDVVNRRLYLKPGITGLWQTGGRSELDWEDGIRLDLYYVENWSLTGDLLILWRTVRMLLRPVGAY